ncbi:MAG: hypothetical protein ACHREM_15800 [Polyangiales bacterium]
MSAPALDHARRVAARNDLLTRKALGDDLRWDEEQLLKTLMRRYPDDETNGVNALISGVRVTRGR